MNWFGVAIILPIIYSLGSYVDKYVLSIPTKRRTGPGTIVIFSWIFALITLPVILFLEQDILTLSLSTILLLITSGIIAMSATALYLYAIDRDEISVVIPIIQMTPIFGFVFGYVLLGEVITPLQGLSALLILLGSVFLTLEITSEEEKISEIAWKKDVFFLATLSALLYAANGAIFKFVALEEGYWNAQFWEYVGVFIFGLVFFLVAKKSREGFRSVIREGRRDYVFLTFTAEMIMVAGDLLMNFAVLLAPIVLVYVINSLQPAVVLLLGVIFTLLIPNFIEEDLHKHKIMQKVISIVVIVLGSIGINLF